MTGAIRRPDAERGLSLALVLMMLTAVLLLALTAARSALLGEKASRNDRDRQQAMRAAEAALLDAEIDILQSAGPPRRDVLAGRESANLPAGACISGPDNPLLGLCSPVPADAIPAWQRDAFVDPATVGAGVPFGRFTSSTFPHAAGPLPVQPPRYIIEILAGKDSKATDRLYRITAVGFGARQASEVVLQSWFRVTAGRVGGDRLAWREIFDWSNDEQNE